MEESSINSPINDQKDLIQAQINQQIAELNDRYKFLKDTFEERLAEERKKIENEASLVLKTVQQALAEATTNYSNILDTNKIQEKKINELIKEKKIIEEDARAAIVTATSSAIIVQKQYKKLQEENTELKKENEIQSTINERLLRETEILNTKLDLLQKEINSKTSDSSTQKCDGNSVEKLITENTILKTQLEVFKNQLEQHNSEQQTEPENRRYEISKNLASTLEDIKNELSYVNRQKDNYNNCDINENENTGMEDLVKLSKTIVNEKNQMEDNKDQKIILNTLELEKKRYQKMYLDMSSELDQLKKEYIEYKQNKDEEMEEMKTKLSLVFDEKIIDDNIKIKLELEEKLQTTSRSLHKIKEEQIETKKELETTLDKIKNKQKIIESQEQRIQFLELENNTNSRKIDELLQTNEKIEQKYRCDLLEIEEKNSTLDGQNILLTNENNQLKTNKEEMTLKIQELFHQKTLLESKVESLSEEKNSLTKRLQDITDNYEKKKSETTTLSKKMYSTRAILITEKNGIIRRCKEALRIQKMKIDTLFKKYSACKEVIKAQNDQNSVLLILGKRNIDEYETEKLISTMRRERDVLQQQLVNEGKSLNNSIVNNCVNLEKSIIINQNEQQLIDEIMNLDENENENDIENPLISSVINYNNQKSNSKENSDDDLKL